MYSISFRVDKELHTRLVALAKANRRSLNEQMAMMLERAACGQLESHIQQRIDSSRSALNAIQDAVNARPVGNDGIDRLMIDKHLSIVSAYDDALNIVRATLEIKGGQQ